MRKIKSENIAEKSNEGTVPPEGGPSFFCILLAEQEMFFSDIFSFQNKVRRVHYSTKFFEKDEDLWEEDQQICQEENLAC